jgi:putative membrane protein
VRSGTKPHPHHPKSPRSRASSASTASTSATTSTVHLPSTSDPVIPAVNAYGTFDTTRLPRSRSRPTSRGSAESGDSSVSIQSRPLLPSMVPNQDTGMMSSVSRDLIPFESIFHFIHRIFQRKPKLELPGNGLLEVNFCHSCSTLFV